MEKPTILMFMCLLSCLGILAQTTVESRVSSTSDDAEETLSTGAVSLTSNDLDIRSSDLNAMRFQLNVPQGATIQDAWIEFKAKDTNSGANTFTFSCQDSDDAAAFGSGSGNLTARTKTSATVNWNVPDWTLDQTYNSVDFAAAVQEVVDRSGWNANNHIVVFVEASGANKRAAKTYDFNGNDSESPKLVVTYQTSGGGGGSTSEVQAESFSAESGTSVSSGNSGFTGTGYVDYGGNGTFAEWVVNLSGTTADFVFRYAVGVAGQNRVCDLLINGNPAGSVNFNSTGGWSTWG
ncbi:MAG: hypothetical protein KI790_21515, partial [Cyclobacteriaceae bacterium]|nr:hypothetical protein [Cyclobacteriaceae bacterium HetDA_MAG_MS6]